MDFRKKEEKATVTPACFLDIYIAKCEFNVDLALF